MIRITVIHVGILGTYHKIDYIGHGAWPVYTRLNAVTSFYIMLIIYDFTLLLLTSRVICEITHFDQSFHVSTSNK